MLSEHVVVERCVGQAFVKHLLVVHTKMLKMCNILGQCVVWLLSRKVRGLTALAEKAPHQVVYIQASVVVLPVFFILLFVVLFALFAPCFPRLFPTKILAYRCDTQPVRVMVAPRFG